MSVKKFIEKGFKANEYDKDDKEGYLIGLIPEIAEWYSRFSFKEFDAVTALFEQMAKNKFISTLKAVTKKLDAGTIDPGFIIVLNDFLEKKAESLDEDQKAIVEKTISKAIKEKTKALEKDTCMPKEVIRELLVVIPDESVVDSKFATIHIQKFTKKLYLVAKTVETGITETKQLKKLFKGIFGKELMSDIVVSILLERKDLTNKFNEAQMKLWNLVTDFALVTIEKGEKEDIKDCILQYYAKRKKDEGKGRDSERRLQLTALTDTEKYPKIIKAVGKLKSEQN